MKYIKGYLLLGLTLILGSCSDFLDRDPDQILTNDQIFSCLLYTSPSPRDA